MRLVEEKPREDTIGLMQEPVGIDAENLAGQINRLAWMPYLARALLKVASNKGAPGVDGESVGMAVQNAPQLDNKLYKSSQLLRFAT